MKKLIKIIITTLSVIFMITISSFSQNQVVIEKVAKKGYTGYMGRTTADVICDDQVITVILCEDHLSSGKKFGIVMLVYDRNTLDLISKIRPFENEYYINEGKFDCRPVVMEINNEYGLYFILKGESSNKIYFQEINIRGELINGPKEMLITEANWLGKRPTNNIQFLTAFTQLGYWEEYYLIEGKTKLKLFEFGEAEKLFKGEAEPFVSDTSKRYNAFNTVSPVVGRYWQYVIDSSNVDKGNLVVEYIMEYTTMGHTSYDPTGAILTGTNHIYEQNNFTISLLGKWTAKIERKFKGESGNYIPTILKSNNGLYVFYYVSTEDLREEPKLCCSRIDWETGAVTEISMKYPYGFSTPFRHVQLMPREDGSFAVLSYKFKRNGLTFHKLTIK